MQIKELPNRVLSNGLAMVGPPPHECRVMGSKMAPLWLVFENAFPDEFENKTKFTVLWKEGDDLRQDQLTLQVMATMDILWKMEGYDMNMVLYKCVSTGSMEGMLEIVENATTVGEITKQGAHGLYDENKNKGGKKVSINKFTAAFGAFSTDVIKKWMVHQAHKNSRASTVINSTSNDATHVKKRKGHVKTRRSGLSNESKESERNEWTTSRLPRYSSLYSSNQFSMYLELMLNNFMFSLAGSIIVTHVLGIGDRHNDNYMIKADGTFFHIDFGHIMGNFKTKAGWDVENKIFVFTKAMSHALGDSRYSKFEAICVETFNIARRNGNLLLTMLYLLTGCGLPELKDTNDLKWPLEKLMLNESDEAAADHIKKHLKIASEASTRSKLKNAAHLWKHT